MKIPMSEIDTVAIDGNLVKITQKSCTMSIQLLLNVFPFNYLFEKQFISDEKKKKLIKYFLASEESPIKSIFSDQFNNDRYRIALKTPYQNIFIENDPEPNMSFRILNFKNLESLHWHMIKHCCFDYFNFISSKGEKNSQPLFSDGNISTEENVSDKWQQFIQEINCPRWKIDLTQQDNRAQWKKNETEFAENNKPGCIGCISEDIDKFIKCQRFFESFRTAYLTKIRKWIVFTIRDQKNKNFYEGSKPVPEDTVLERQHIHIEKDGKQYIYAYIVEENNQKKDVYIIIFEGTNNRNSYIIKTVYGIGSRDNKEYAMDLINKNVEKQNHHYSIPIKNYCHTSNWLHSQPPSREKLEQLTQKFG